MAKGLSDHCLSHEKTLERVRARVKKTEEEQAKLKAWKICHKEKLKLSETARGELEKEVDLMKGALTEKNESLRHAKADAIKEYRDSDALLCELGTSFSEGFDDCLRQVKASFLELNLSHITIDPEGLPTAPPVYAEGTDELFGEEPNDGEAQKVDAKGSVEDDARQPSIQGPGDEEDTIVVTK